MTRSRGVFPSTLQTHLVNEVFLAKCRGRFHERDSDVILFSSRKRRHRQLLVNPRRQGGSYFLEPRFWTAERTDRGAEQMSGRRLLNHYFRVAEEPGRRREAGLKEARPGS